MILECEDCLHTVLTTPSVHPTKTAHRVQIQCLMSFFCFFLISLQMTYFHFAPQCRTLTEHTCCMCTVQHMEDGSGTKYGHLCRPKGRRKGPEGALERTENTRTHTCRHVHRDHHVGPVQSVLVGNTNVFHHRPSCSKAQYVNHDPPGRGGRSRY